MKNEKINIGIIGAGKIGLALATLWQRKGYAVTLGSRDPNTMQTKVDQLGLPVRVQTVAATAAENELIVLAVPYSAVPEVTAAIKDAAAGKVILDATNPFGLSSEGVVFSTLGSDLTAGTRMATLLPNSKVVRAFTHIPEELLVSRGTQQPGFFAVAIAGDEVTAKQTVSELAQDAGFVPLDIGSLAESAPLDPGGVLFPKVTMAEMKRMLVREPHAK